MKNLLIIVTASATAIKVNKFINLLNKTKKYNIKPVLSDSLKETKKFDIDFDTK